MGEALFCAVLFVLGVTSLTALVTTQVMSTGSPRLGFWLMVLVLASFAIMGGVGLVWTVLRLGISAERAQHPHAASFCHRPVPCGRLAAGKFSYASAARRSDEQPRH